MSQTLPQIRKYGRQTANEIVVTVGSLDVYFSYVTPVAFRHPDTGLVVSENVWSVTTGRHLNEIDGGNKKARLPRDLFETALASVTA